MRILLFAAAVGFCVSGWCAGQAAAAEPAASGEAAGQLPERLEKFQRALSGATLEGRFTTLGKDEDVPRPEQYVIQSLRKLPEGDYWLFQARIKYGDKDLTVPLPLEVKWAGDTPVITLDRLNIPGLGVFSARVVIDGTRYAGTWSHDEVGGHLFGVVTPAAGGR